MEAEVQIAMSDEWARHFEKEMLTPRGLMLAGPLRFGVDDLPTYIISPTDELVQSTTAMTEGDRDV